MEQPLLLSRVEAESARSIPGSSAPYDPGPDVLPCSINPGLVGPLPVASGEESSELAAACHDDVALHKVASMRQFQIEGHRQWRLALPICTMNVFNVLLAMVSVIFVGHLGAKELAAGALATGVANVTGIAVLVSPYKT